MWRVGVLDVGLSDPRVVGLVVDEGAGAGGEVLEGGGSGCTGGCSAQVAAGGRWGGARVGEWAGDDVFGVGEEVVGEFDLSDGGKILE